MNAVLRPHWLALGAVIALAVALAGFIAGWVYVSPMGLLVSEILLILAAITFTTPNLPPAGAATPAADGAEQDAAADAPPE